MTARRLPRCAAVAAALASFVVVPAGRVVVPAARAAAVPLDLTWDAPAGCPSAADVVAEVERLAHEPSTEAPTRLAAEAHIEPRDARWHLRLLTRRDGVAGERVLEADSCASLAHAATLVLVLALGEGQAPRPVPAAPAPAPPPRPAMRAAPLAPPTRAVVEPAAPPPEPPVVVTPALPLAPTLVRQAVPRPARAPVTWDVAAEARVGWGPTPADVGYDVGLDVARGRSVAMLRLAGWPSDDGATAAPGVRARYEAGGATLSACVAAVRAARVVVAGCVGAGAAAVRGASAGAPFDGAATAAWYTVTPALRVRVHLAGAVHVEARVDGTTSLTRPRFVVGNFGEVYTVRRFAPASVVGLSVDL
jgi:hypothetical protein